MEVPQNSTNSGESRPSYGELIDLAAQMTLARLADTDATLIVRQDGEIVEVSAREIVGKGD